LCYVNGLYFCPYIKRQGTTLIVSPANLFQIFI
jgi:hypothetical protein